MVTHWALSVRLKIPEIALEENDANILSTATMDLLDLYDIKFDPKIAAMITLMGVSGKIYGDKFLAYKLRLSMEVANANT